LVLEAVDYLPQQPAIGARGPSPVEAIKSPQACPALVRFRCFRRQWEPAGGAGGAPYKFKRVPTTGAKLQRLGRRNRLPATGTGGRIEEEEELVREPAKERGRPPDPRSNPFRGASRRRATRSHGVTLRSGSPWSSSLGAQTGSCHLHAASCLLRSAIWHLSSCMKLHASKVFSVTQGQSFLVDQTCRDSGRRLGRLLISDLWLPCLQPPAKRSSNVSPRSACLQPRTSDGPKGPCPPPYAFLAISSMIAEANSEQRTSRAPAICRARS
jgi:hypothetical protein